jgi:hypothetical protein
VLLAAIWSQALPTVASLAHVERPWKQFNNLKKSRSSIWHFYLTTSDNYQAYDFLRGLPVSVEKFLKQRAVNISLTGKYTLPNWYDPRGRLRTFHCRTTRVSPFRMMVDAPVVGKVGDNLTSYFHEFGKFEGSISDTAKGAFLLEIHAAPSAREKLANKLTWIETKQNDPSIPDRRQHPRIIPENPGSSVTFADGTTHDCSVIDVSASGAAVLSSAKPQVGTPLAVGSCIGRVVRELPDGFAIKFVEPQKARELNRLLARRATLLPQLNDKPIIQSNDTNVVVLDF